MPIPLRVLLVEDSEDDADLLLHELRRGGYEPRWKRVDTAAGLTAALSAEPWDVITCDYVMPQFSAPAALKCIRASGLDLPIIIVSGQVGEEVAVTAMKAGAHDYVSKDRMARLVPAIEREVAEAAARRAAEATLRASEEKYRELVEALHDVIFEVDASGAITYISPAIEALSGYRPADVTGTPFTAFVHPEDIPALLNSVAETARGHANPAEFRVLNRAGEVRWVRTSSRPICAADGTLLGLRGVLSDVTARREAEDAYRAVFEYSTLGLAVAQGDRIVLANRALAALSGWDLGDIIGQPIAALTYGMVHPDDLSRMLAATRNFLDGKRATETDFRVVRRDGAVRRVLTTQTDFHYRGAPARLIAYTDVTDQWSAEAAYRAVFEHSTLGLVVSRQDGRFAMVNPSFLAMVGLTREQYLGLSAQEVNDRYIHPDDLADVNRYLAGWQYEGRPAAPFEYRWVRPDGDVRTLHCRAARIEFEGTPCVLCSVADLTDRRRAEAAYRAVFERSQHGLLLGREGRPLMANQALREIVGLSPEQFAGLSMPDLRRTLVHPDDRARLRGHVANWLANGTVPAPFELRVLRPDGEQRLLLCHPAQLELDGAPAALVSFTDLTERRRAEEAYRMIFQHSIQGLVLIKRNRIAMANPAVSEITGFPLDELLATPVDELALRVLHPAELQHFAMLTEQWMKSGVTPDRYTFRIRRADGSDGALFVQNGHLMHDGEPALLVAIADMTQRWRAEEAYRAVFDHSLQGLTVVRGQHVLMANPAMEELTGYSIEELLQIPSDALVEQLVHADDRAQVRDGLAHAAPADAPNGARSEFRFVRKDGSVRNVLTQSSRIDFAGTPALLVAHLDITERSRAEAALRTLNGELEARVAERTAALASIASELETFSYSVSHDLRAPLRSIDGFTQAVLTEHAALLPPTAVSDLERVRKASHRMSELIDRLLAMARVRRVALRRTSIDVSALAREVVDELRSGDPQRGVAVAIAEGLRADGDAALVRALLSNLLANAWKFTRRCATPQVEIGRTGHNGESSFFVRDNGVGFDMQEAGQLFRPFHRLHSESEFDGHGIGLATVERIVSHHGGRVWAEAGVGRGATFYFTLG